jgi:hypothetical protein
MVEVQRDSMPCMSASGARTCRGGSSTSRLPAGSSDALVGEHRCELYVGLMEQDMVTRTVSVVDGGGLLV